MNFNLLKKSRSILIEENARKRILLRTDTNLFKEKKKKELEKFENEEEVHDIYGHF
jgi:hypothetical protein